MNGCNKVKATVHFIGKFQNNFFILRYYFFDFDIKRKLT